MTSLAFIPSLPIGMLEPQDSAYLVPIGVMFFVAVIVVSIQYAKIRRREMWHQTARVALEKGQPLPPPDKQEETSRSGLPSGPRDIRAGLILIAVGAGLALFLGKVHSVGMGYMGVIPGFIGVALLLYGVVQTKLQKATDKEGLPAKDV